MMLTLSHLRKDFPDFSLNMDVEFKSDNVTAILGQSGSGKTTLINLISGLTKPDAGIIRLRDQILVDVEKKCFVPPQKRRIGYVFQDSRLFPHYSVKSNLTYAMPRHYRAQFETIVELLHIEALLARYPKTLSGGEKQRVAIGRALLSDPALLLMDEPLASLDVPHKKELLSYLTHLAEHIHVPIVYVSHDLREITQLADQVILLEKGRVIAQKNGDTLRQDPIFQEWSYGDE